MVMKRRIPFKFIPVHRVLFGSWTSAFGQQGESSVAENSLAERLGLKPLAAQQEQSPAPNGLDHWVKAPRFPVWEPGCPLGRIFIMAIHSGHPCTFVYHGGSSPGAKRTVIPAQLFTVGRSDTLYLAAWCMNAEAHRTFRIDRVELLG